MNRRLPGVLLCIVLVLVTFCSSVSALELTVGTPVASETGDVFEIPVILKNDIEFAGFTCEVGNSVDGAVITLSDEKTLKDFTYIPNSDESNEFQRLIAYSLGYTTDPELHLFTIIVNITDSSLTNIPLNISLRDVIQNDATFYPLDKIITSGLSNIKLRDGISADVTTEAEERLIPELMVSQATNTATVSPTVDVRPSGTETSSTGQTVVSSQISAVSTQSQSVSTQTSSSSTQSVPQSQDGVLPTEASSPGFGMGVIFAGLGIATVLLKRKMH